MACGLEVRPQAILEQLAVKVMEDIGMETAGSLLQLMRGRISWPGGWMSDLSELQRGFWFSLLHDPAWHYGWTADVLQKSTRLLTTIPRTENPRVRGPFA